MTGRLLEVLGDKPFLIGLLRSLTKLPRSEVQARLEQESLDLGSQVRDAFQRAGLTPYVWDDRLAAFYSQTDSFLFETLVWNRHPVKIDLRNWILRFLQKTGRHSSRILTFGDGLGIDSIALAAAGHQVDYFEVSQLCIQFARQLGDQVGVQPNYLESLPQSPRESYDVVVCLDVLEHVPDPPGTVAMLASWLKDGGQLIVHAPFWYIHPAVMTHLAKNRTYSGDLRRLYRAHQLHPIDGRFFWMPLVLEKNAGDAPPVPSLPTRLKLGTSGLLLSIARYWCQPHVWISRFLSHVPRRAPSIHLLGFAASTTMDVCGVPRRDEVPRG
jgi:2-polyprenyl-3-methyl-5-hydroxy-6-metoxy-1,4-benzoquinol methylase